MHIKTSSFIPRGYKKVGVVMVALLGEKNCTRKHDDDHKKLNYTHTHSHRWLQRRPCHTKMRVTCD